MACKQEFSSHLFLKINETIFKMFPVSKIIYASKYEFLYHFLMKTQEILQLLQTFEQWSFIATKKQNKLAFWKMVNKYFEN